MIARSSAAPTSLERSSVLHLSAGRMGAFDVNVLARSLNKCGLDVVAPLALSWYNDAIPEELRLSVRQSSGAVTADDCLVVIVGNSRQLWPLFLAAYTESADVRYL